MEKRHFVVHFAEQGYSLKEITPEIAESMSTYGVTVTDYPCDNGEHWWFYFMNTALTTKDQRHAIVEALVQGMQTAE